MRPDLKQIILTDIEIPQECKKRQFIGVDLAPKATALSRWLRNEEQLLRDVRVSVSQGRKMMIHQLEDSSVFSYPNQRFVGMWLVYRGEDLYEVCTSIKTGQRESNVLNLRMRRNLECKNKFTKGTGRILEGTGGDKWGIYPLFLMSSPAATESLFWVQLPRESPSMQNLTTVLIPRMHLASKAPSHQFSCYQQLPVLTQLQVTSPSSLALYFFQFLDHQFPQMQFLCLKDLEKFLTYFLISLPYPHSYKGQIFNKNLME